MLSVDAGTMMLVSAGPSTEAETCGRTGGEERLERATGTTRLGLAFDEQLGGRRYDDTDDAAGLSWEG